jgi:glycosyltransferase involved in cell wall biosynthesis
MLAWPFGLWHSAELMLSQPKRVGFLDRAQGNFWLGGNNYLRNLFVALEATPESQIRPVVFSPYRGTSMGRLPGTEGVKSAAVDLHLLFENRFQAWLLNAAPVLDGLLQHHQIACFSHGPHLGAHARTPLIGWIPDLQHKHLTRFFTPDEIAMRDWKFRLLLEQARLLVVSSENARSDIDRFFPGHSSKLRVLRFADCASPSGALPSRSALEAQHGFRGQFLLLPNQYWVHKNHQVVIEALGILKSRGQRVLVLSTGSTQDYRAPGHFEALMRRRNELGVDDWFRVLGVIEYAHLSALMRGACAIINPSLFEGWSTTVEEAKSLGKRLVLSDIAVHREQAPERKAFFRPDDAEQLAGLIWAAWNEYSAEEDELAGRRAARALPSRRRDYAMAYAALVNEIA